MTQGQGALDSVDVALDPSEMEGMDEQALKDKYDDYVKEQRKANSSALPDDSYEDEKKSKKKKPKVRVLADDIRRLCFVFVATAIAAAQLAASHTLLSRTARKTKTSGFDIIATYARFCCCFCVNCSLSAPRPHLGIKLLQLMYFFDCPCLARLQSCTCPGRLLKRPKRCGDRRSCSLPDGCRAAVQARTLRSALSNRIFDYGAELAVTAAAEGNSCAAKVYRLPSAN